MTRDTQSIKERALEINPYRGTSPYDEYESGLCIGWDNGYIQGATEQQAIDDDHLREVRKMVIDKACEWFSNYLMEIGYPDDWMRDSKVQSSGEMRFRKAMKE